MKSRSDDIAAYLEPARSCVCFSLRKTARAVTQLYDAALRPCGLRATQFTMLTAVRVLGGVTVNHLAEALVMDRTTLTRNLTPLKRDGLIRVQPGADRREREVTLTAAGWDILTRAMPLWEQAQGRITKGLGQDRVGHMLKDLGAATYLGLQG